MKYYALFSIFAAMTSVGAFAEALDLAAKQSSVTPIPKTEAPHCSNDYADEISSLLPNARELEMRLSSYTFCIRTAATYECPSYGPDGNLRRKKMKVVAHGTGFGYRQQGGETLIITNQHVSDWTAVTDEEHTAQEIPVGCKRVSDSLKIVDDESDTYERDDISLAKVVVDPQLDIAILKSKTQLPVMPWKIGHSANLKVRNVVDVRGFPLGVFKATNAGKVIAVYDHDEYKDWDHNDFVVDALLSPGNSGSPVFAVSCKTGEFELVGVYHAGYTQGSALNVVVGIDQIRDLMTTLKRDSKPRPENLISLDSGARTRLYSLAKKAPEPFFPLGSMTAAVRTRADGTLIYELLNRSFPSRSYPVFVIEDLPSIGGNLFGQFGRVWIGNRQGLKIFNKLKADAETQAQLDKLLDGLRQVSIASFDLNDADKEAATSREKFEKSKRLEKVLRKINDSHSELIQNSLEIAEHHGPQPGDVAVELRALLEPNAGDQKNALPATASASGK